MGLILPATIAAAGEKLDPAARAKVIAPFVDEQTFAVAHVDVSRIALDPLVAKAMELLPGEKEELAAGKANLAAVQQQFLRAGARDVYVVFTSTLLPSREPIFWVIPLGPAADEKAILASLPAQRPGHARIGGSLVFADLEATLKRVQELNPAPRPELAAAFEAAGDTAAQVLLIPPAYSRRVIEETMPELPKEIGGGPSTVLTRGLLWAAAGIDLPPKTAIRVVIQSRDAQAAMALDAKRAEVLRRLGQHKEVRSLVPDFDRIVSLLTPQVEGDRLVLSISGEKRAMSILWSALGPPFAAATEAAGRSQSMNNLKQIALAMHMYHDDNKCLPPATYSPDGKPLLSWRVLILPYIEQNQFYHQFHLNEAWDSPHNRTLIDKMPSVYRCPGSKLREKGRTNYVVPVGPQTVFYGRQGTPFKDITDGTSNTIMVLECDDAHAPIWTKPDDLPFDPKNPMKGLGHIFTGGFDAAFCDASVRFISATVSPDVLRALFTKAGGEAVGSH